MKTIELEANNIALMKGAYTLGDNNFRCGYSINKNVKMMVIFLEVVPDDWTDEQINEQLKDCKLILNDKPPAV